MKTIYLISLFLLSVTFMSCDGDDDNVVEPALDTESPVLSVTTTLGVDTFLIIQRVAMNIKVTDNRGLNDLKVYLAGPDGARKLAYEYIETNSVIRYREFDVGIPFQKGAPTGKYMVMVEARDQAQNMAKDSLSITIHASALGKFEFSRIFVDAFSLYHEALDWYGYNIYDKGGIAFNSKWLSLALYFMVSFDNDYSISEKEWSKFIADFGFQNQRWATWDATSDGYLDEAEFADGLESLGLFDEWDSNKDDLVDGEEMANGFFSRWDLNKDNLLSREEYLEKFYRYF